MDTRSLDSGQRTGASTPPEPRRVSRGASRRTVKSRPAKDKDDTVKASARPVTPELTSSIKGNTDHTVLSWPMSQATSLPMGRKLSDQPISASNTDEESTTEHQRRRVSRRPKHRDDTLPETSPNSFLTKTRRRLGSITTASSLVRQDPPGSSIGYPSVLPPPTFPDLESIASSLPAVPRRTVSSDGARASSAASARSLTALDADSNRILHLMKTTSGRMHGILFYRPAGTNSWHSGYCAINVAPGSLVCQAKGDVTQAQTLIPDLRGCSIRTHLDPHSQTMYLSIVLPMSGIGFQLRPPVPETFDSWLAAFLCWQPLRPKGVFSSGPSPPTVEKTEEQLLLQRQFSDLLARRTSAIVKAGQMFFWFGPLPSASQRHARDVGTWGSPEPESSSSWQRVNCTLHENGTFKLLSEGDARPVCTVRLSQLLRCAVQRLDDSVLNVDHCLALYPQYTARTQSSVHSRPLIFRLDSQANFEAWYVLLRALTVPELYGPKNFRFEGDQDASAAQARTGIKDLVRVERTLSVKVTEAKFTRGLVDSQSLSPYGSTSEGSRGEDTVAGVYADVILGHNLRGRTSLKPCATSAFWVEEFTFRDMPTVSPKLSIALKMAKPGEQEWSMITQPGDKLPDDEDLSSFEAIEVANSDTILGKVELSLSDFRQDKPVEKWWPLTDSVGTFVGQVLVRFALTDNVVLMQSEYEPLSTLLHAFENGLTTQVAQIIGSELKELSDVFLDYFQSTTKSDEWIGTLIEEEIDGIYRETPPVRMRFSGRIHSNDSYESGEHRELLVRDLSRSATMEANLLFRGNSLVTKALDAYMKRQGRTYLEQTLGDVLRSLMLKDPNCEVDPNRLRPADQLERNWANLIFWTTNVWKAIAASAATCPVEMRFILRHVKSCAEDRYGSFIRTVKYTSVSGFLFLRFFCPAILNPKLFGLLDAFPAERTRRTFTFIAKSIIVLANMTKFGQKEPWMEPMNKFLTSATPEFKDFIEQVCSPDPRESSTLIEPRFQAPSQVRSRLPPPYQEGLPSLPHLLDSAKLSAIIVDIWSEHAPPHIADTGIDNCIQSFHEVCSDLRRRTKERMANVGFLSPAKTNPGSKFVRTPSGGQSNGPDGATGLQIVHRAVDEEITALPQHEDDRFGALRNNHREFLTQAFDLSQRCLSPTPMREYQRPASGTNTPSVRTGVNGSRNSSSTSVAGQLEFHAQQMPPPRERSSRPRLSDRIGSSSRGKDFG